MDKTPPDVNRGSFRPPQPQGYDMSPATHGPSSRPFQSQGYDMSLANPGPSSRPPPHPAIHSNPYDDPYYYYGALEMGVPQGPSVNVSRGQANVVPSLRLDEGISGGLVQTLISKQ